MVVFTPRFTTLAVLVSVAAFTLIPSADAAAIAIRGHSSHLSHSHTASAHAASVTPDSSSAHPVIPLPARLQKPKQTESEGSKDKKKKGKKDKKRPKRLVSWNSGSTRAEVEDLPPLLVSRALHRQPEVFIDGENDHVEFGRSPEPHHHHHHHHHHGDVDKVIVKGDNDNVHIGRSVAPDHSHDLAERIAEAHVDANPDNVFHPRSPEPHHHGDHVDEVVAKGDNDNVHLRRSPSPYHHHHHHGDYVDKVIIKGDNDNVNVKRVYSDANESEDVNYARLKRSPERHHHHHHHHHHHYHGDHVDKVIVKGDNDNVHVGRSPEPRSHYHHGEYLKRSPMPHHHHHGDHIDKIIVKGDNDNVHVKRSPHHHHHHNGDHVDKVIIKGDNDNVHLKRSIAFQDAEGNKYVVPYHEHVLSVIGDNMDENVRGLMKRLEGAVMEGTPGTVDIVSPIIHDAAHNVSSTGTHLASLVLQAPAGPSGASVQATASSPWILNASEKNNTQVYLIPITSTTASMNGTATNATAADVNGDIPVLLTVSIFDPNSASTVAYCATFDPSPPAPAPLTAEPCFAGASSPPHKSQTFSYTPATGGLSPTWFNGEDDGKDADGDEDASAPQDPHTPQSAGAASITSAEDDASPGDFGNATAPASIADIGGNSTTNDASLQDGLKPRTQNVKMIFTPATPELPADINKLQNGTSSLSSSIIGASVPSPITVVAVNSTGGSALSGAGSSPASTNSSGSTQSTDSPEELSVMVGIARDEGSAVVGARDAMMTPVSTAPYKWRFRRDHL